MGAPPPAAAAEPLRVVASFSVLADIASQVGGERVAVTSLVGPDGDAHVFQPSPADAKAVAAAQVLVLNGLGLEGWMTRLAAASGFKGVTATATAGIKPLRTEADGHAGHGHGTGDADPHAWQSLVNGKLYAANIRDAFVKADPEGRAAYEANATRYLAALDALDREAKAEIEAVPATRRRVITSHDAFAYFAKAYGIEFIAPQGVSTESEASARDVARIIRQVKAQRIPAVFVENISDRRLLDQIARETGARIGGTLYSDALSGPGGPAATYLDMIRHNVRTIVAALKP